MGLAERALTRPRDLFPPPDRESRQHRAGPGSRGCPPTAASQPGPVPRPNPIAGYEDWLATVRSAAPYIGADSAGTALGRVLGLRRLGGRPTVLDDGGRRLDGVMIRRLRWSVGYGPETTAWLLRPAGVRRSLPGALGMHSHGGVRSVGAEQLVDLGADASPRAAWLRDLLLRPGRRQRTGSSGLMVLVHDTFSWGSRRFDLSRPTPRLAVLMEAQDALWRQQRLSPTEEERFDLASGLHEDTLAKAAALG